MSSHTERPASDGSLPSKAAYNHGGVDGFSGGGGDGSQPSQHGNSSTVSVSGAESGSREDAEREEGPAHEGGAKNVEAATNNPGEENLYSPHPPQSQLSFALGSSCLPQASNGPANTSQQQQQQQQQGLYGQQQVLPVHASPASATLSPAQPSTEASEPVVAAVPPALSGAMAAVQEQGQVCAIDDEEDMCPVGVNTCMQTNKIVQHARTICVHAHRSMDFQGVIVAALLHMYFYSP